MRWEWVWSCPYEDAGWRVWMEDQIGKVALQTVWEQKVKDCTRCGLHEHRNNIVFGNGNTERPDLLFLGEGPGAHEDDQGVPFVGQAGKLLDKILAAVGLKRADVYICNCVACRPPENRDPRPDELEACAAVRGLQIIAVRPRVIVALGKVAGNAILGTRNEPITKLRKLRKHWNKIPVQVTYHPAAMLRNESYKQPAWEDLQAAMRLVEAQRAREKRSGPLFGD